MNARDELATKIAKSLDALFGNRDFGPAKQDYELADALQAEYLFIRRDELPKAGITLRDGEPHIKVKDSDAGTWPAKANPATHRAWGLEYLAAAECMAAWHADQESVLTKRRDEVAAQLGYIGAYEALIENAPMRKAIDRIVALEDGVNA